MARQQKKNPEVGDTNEKGNEQIQTLSNADVDPLPEQGLTQAAADAAPKEPTERAPAKALQQSQERPTAEVKYFRVQADRMVMGSVGTRARLRAGKVVSTTTYNINRLKQQGVQLQEISEDEARSVFF